MPNPLLFIWQSIKTIIKYICKYVNFLFLTKEKQQQQTKHGGYLDLYTPDFIFLLLKSLFFELSH